MIRSALVPALALVLVPAGAAVAGPGADLTSPARALAAEGWDRDRARAFLAAVLADANVDPAEGAILKALDSGQTAEVAPGAKLPPPPAGSPGEVQLHMVTRPVDLNLLAEGRGRGWAAMVDLATLTPGMRDRIKAGLVPRCRLFYHHSAMINLYKPAKDEIEAQVARLKAEPAGVRAEGLQLLHDAWKVVVGDKPDSPRFLYSWLAEAAAKARAEAASGGSAPAVGVTSAP